MKIERIDGLPLTSGKCQNATNANDPNYGNFSAILSTPRRYVLMLPSVCMEKDVSYVVRVTYSRHESNSDGADTILTDSVSCRLRECSLGWLSCVSFSRECLLLGGESRVMKLLNSRIKSSCSLECNNHCCFQVFNVKSQKYVRKFFFS